jgi:hypothetical protein
MTTYQMIDPGIYTARATQGELGIHPKSGNDQAVVVFEILEGTFQGETIRWYAVLTEKTQKFVIPGLTLCGWSGEIGDDGKTMLGITDNEVEIEVIHEEYQGKTIAKVRGVVNPNASLAGKPMTPGERANFASRWGGVIEGYADAQRAARAARPGDADGGASSDGYPY